MKTTKFSYAIVSGALLSLTMASVTHAQETSVLNATQHPPSPSYQTLFPEKIIPLDAKLSWKQRFNGDETFNENEVLESVATTIDPTQEPNHKSRDASKDDAMKMDGSGTIKQIKSDQGKIKVKHGPIDRLGMPAMTMVFKVEDEGQLADLEKDQEVRFSIDNSSGGFVITDIIVMSGDQDNTENTSSGMDATGEIKAIRPNQGKIKIKHGPIDRLGMPAMTMMFKVDDPNMLKGLKKGKSVNFSVNNTSGGFVITHIESAE